MKAYVRLLIVLIVSALLCGGVYLGMDADWTRLQKITVNLAPGNEQKILYSKIEEALQSGLADIQGRRVWSVSLKELMGRVEKDRRVKSARISRRLPNEIVVEVVPHHPVAAWIDERGRYVPVAMDASLLPSLSLKEALDVPLLRGKNFADDQKLREQAVQIIASLPERGPLQIKKIAEITFQPDVGFSLLLTQGGIEVKIGEGDIGLKASRIEKVLNYLQDQQLRGRVIDARFAKKVVVRLRNGL